MTRREKVLLNIFISLFIVTLTTINVFVYNEKRQELLYYRNTWEQTASNVQKANSDIEFARSFIKQDIQIENNNDIPELINSLTVSEAYRKSFQEYNITMVRYSMTGTSTEGSIDFVVTGSKTAIVACMASWNVKPLPGSLISANFRARDDYIESTLKVQYTNEAK
jgi:hypothetical protein